MEPMRRPGDIPTGYERGTIKESALLSEPSIESTVFGLTLQWDSKSVHEFVTVANSDHPMTASSVAPIYIEKLIGICCRAIILIVQC
ncbi:hypothetical protein PR003_g1968 [Phytophthora rubi]|uniref:Uncharacterized protein n=1 Tax=Phytophthora rubi TaxID=129364 RepID=A0A6A4G286_9STRA|nr:hypothetical protein PR001_g1914 [Phytophthora rubi]KAE9357081.1 hypothetical protein PR003_g1968 [Phytophthora rubi]